MTAKPSKRGHQANRPAHPLSRTEPPSQPRSTARLLLWPIMAAAGLLVAGVLAGRMWLNRPEKADAGVSPKPVAVSPASQPMPPKAVPTVPVPDQRLLKDKAEAENGLIERINRANQLLAQDKPADALEVLREAEKLSPEDEDVHYNLGITLARLGKNEEALKEYNEALRIFPDYAEVHNNLGNLLLRMGKKEEAVQHLEQAVKLTPDYASAWNNLGKAQQQLGLSNAAAEHFEKAVQLDTNYWQAHYNLALSLLQRRQLAEARTRFETVLKLQPDFAPAQEALARIAQETGPAAPQP